MIMVVVVKTAVAIAAAAPSSSTTRLLSSPILASGVADMPSIPPSPRRGGIVVCAGLSCLDLQLLGCTDSGGGEAIERYDEAVHCAGGSASMTATTLALLLERRGSDASGDVDEEEVHVLTKLGPDFAGSTLQEFYRRAGARTDLVLVDPEVRTSMAVLPVYRDGRRGCFVNLACNDGFAPEELLGRLDGIDGASDRPVRAFLFGYPHLMPRMRGEALQLMLREARRKLSPVEGGGVLVGVDLNGVDGSDPAGAREALIPALGEVDVLHLNEDEASILSSSSSSRRAACDNDSGAVDGVDPEVLAQIASFHEEGCAVVLLSLGSRGAFVSVTPDSQRLQRFATPPSSQSSSDLPSTPPRTAVSRWIPGTQLRVPAYRIPSGDVNANGAGDALFAGFCLAASSWGREVERTLRGEGDWSVTPRAAGTFGALTAWQRCDARTRDGDGMRSAARLMEMIRRGDLPEALDK
ncbi:hypothetical protein ACHAWF_007963 [Thalassiosira exigua]